MLTAVTRIPSQSLPECELSFLERQPIDVGLARRQHRAYQDALRAAGTQVVELPALDQLPDATFVEDTTIVLDEIAIIAPMGALSRRAESAAMANVLSAYRPLHRLTPPATLDGGDVLRLGRTLWIGLTPRTNAEAVDQVGRLLAPHGYRVVPVPVTRCLHLKSGVTRLDDNTALVNPEWVDPAILGSVQVVPVDEAEPWGANALRVAETVIVPASEPRTRRRVKDRGFRTVAVDVSELQKAEAGVTCLSVVFETSGMESRHPRR
jgi:dimethylargininase